MMTKREHLELAALVAVGGGDGHILDVCTDPQGALTIALCRYEEKGACSVYLGTHRVDPSTWREIVSQALGRTAFAYNHTATLFPQES